ncbi:YceH family protein [Quatrionicoccus australiensis]|uniref:YceH family protein n=1 Tax=Quatrionicoccus australiensis TaxID=138118 RepID=UPI001CFBC469|nr:YceH family protein [Quatrionicoccus australiensis]MCB4358123.1 YceH family protein [Quatrionicoccus australiensis]
MSLSLPVLSLVETRVLATLVEKQRTVPDTYPLSINALAAGCNQKTSRNPVLELGEPEILQAIDSLKDLGLVSEVSGSRVARFAHNLERQLGVPSQSAALLTVLMLRGPQTAGELRLNCERLHKFADISSVEAFLEELAERADGALVLRLARLPGTREERWTHLLSGQPAAESPVAGTGKAAASEELADLKARVGALETEVAELKALLLAKGA